MCMHFFIFLSFGNITAKTTKDSQELMCTLLFVDRRIFMWI